MSFRIHDGINKKIRKGKKLESKLFFLNAILWCCSFINAFQEKGKRFWQFLKCWLLGQKPIACTAQVSWLTPEHNKETRLLFSPAGLLLPLNYAYSTLNTKPLKRNRNWPVSHDIIHKVRDLPRVRETLPLFHGHFSAPRRLLGWGGTGWEPLLQTSWCFSAKLFPPTPKFFSFSL